jgi:restriction system protein
MSPSINFETSFASIYAEIDRTIDDLNRDAAKQVQRGNYAKAEEIINQCKQLHTILTKLKSIEGELKKDKFFSKPNDERSKQVREISNKRKRGKRTPQSLFIRPLLQTLVNLGGSGTSRKVEKEAFPLLKPYLTEFEFTPLASFSNKPRWTHRLHWTRYQLVEEGLLLSSSPRGVWEISESGRNWLEDFVD